MAPAMYPPVVACLQCPLCQGSLEQTSSGTGVALRCGHGHSFDIAKQGYANLACPAPAYAGDTAEMVAARASFLEAGHYRFIAEAVVEAVRRSCGPDAPPLAVEAGAGTGYYLSALLDARPDFAGLALDVSKAALRRAAKAHAHAAAALCDVWRQMPVATGVAGAVLSIFAPRNGAEFRRILHPRGVVVVVAPTAAHLSELIGPLELLSVAPNKDEAVAASLAEHFERVDERHCESLLHLSHGEAATLAGMGPSAFHLQPGQLAAAVAALPESMAVTASVCVSTYRLR